ncbi:hypothetical protein NEDG_02253 [Nematocida displodere]|uniref:RING-type domain-containing protein n=1 Tax=Nematocida displodere TaxID=1805483 RepID=A0A177EE85_9MICR|nr:hypothetical protein NEDG_02253 [Nematocida displodere]
MMKSNPVRSFGKVFGTGLGRRLGRVMGKALRCHVLCLIVLCVIVGCADEVSEPEYIVSPYTKQTIKFFERSRSDWSTDLKTVKVGKKRCLLRKQTESQTIYLDMYTPKNIPKNLVKGIVFSKLTIDSNGPFDPAVLEKILSAFGTINADVLALKKLKVRVSSYSGKHSAIQPLRCVLNVKELTIYATPKTTIGWLQERVDLSWSRIRLLIYCRSDFGNLEVLDGFNAAEITSLTLCDIDNLATLDCKLFREGPLPDVLEISGDNAVVMVLEISEQIIRNMLAKEWVNLKMPVELWDELMEPSEHPKHLTADTLTIWMESPQVQTLPLLGVTRATVTHLNLVTPEQHRFPPMSSLEPTLDWVSKGFEGLETLNVRGLYVSGVREFVKRYTIDITTIPTLTSIKLEHIECLHIPSIIRDDSNILCLSLEAWELFGSGKLADELANSRTNPNQLSPEHQAIAMSKEEMNADDNACHVCLCTANELKAVSPDAEICILDHPKHSICNRCLDGMVNESRISGHINCPVCRQEHMLPLVKNRIERNSQGMLVITMPTPLSALSFPRATQPELPAI